MFDTTSTSLGIGVTGTDHPSSNLYVTGNAYVSSNIAVGGVLTMGTVNVVARHDLEAVTALGNTTPVTLEFTNPTTSLVASGNVEVAGNVVAGYLYGDGSNITGISSASNLQVVTDTGNVTSNTIQFSNATTSLTATSNIEVAGFVGSSGTGALTLPSGTMAQQPSTGLVGGMIRFNSTSNRLEVYNGTAWQSVGGMSATGGTTATISGYKIHAFTSSGTFTVLSRGGGVDYLVVAGGGGGGFACRGVAGGGGGGESGEGGGGGAGGMMTGTIPSLAPNTYNIIVGTGGLGGRGSGISSARVPTNGNNSSFNGLVASGGGVGGQHTPSQYPTSGGSGGGGTHTRVTPGNAIDSNFGNAGGLGTENIIVGAGGGGAGAAGQASTSSKGGDGGVGSQSSISGTSTYYAGGGGGGRRLGSPHGNGGNGGGGNGGSNGVNGSNNTGGGGGGGGGNTSTVGGDGGSGIVIIRYLV